jgi:hypothetical protein
MKSLPLMSLFALAAVGCSGRGLQSSSDLGTTSQMCGVNATSSCGAGFFCEAPAGLCPKDPSPSSVCTEEPLDCLAPSGAGQPECGCDHHTYASDCARRQDGVSLLHSGACESDCPSDLFDAVGTSCSVEGQTCGGPCLNYCQFCNLLECQNGIWTQVESSPDPSCQMPDGGTDGGSNACTRAGGYCALGDLVTPTCDSGTHEDDSITKANPGVCQLGICCVPDDDCRTKGCQPGSSCAGCLTPTGVDYLCLGNGAAC